MNRYPHTIENGAGEKLTFLGISKTETGEERLDAEVHVQPGFGPPMHVHKLQEEVMTVKSGKVAYQILGEEVRYASVGETMAFPPGVAHKYWNAGDTELWCTGWAKPPDNLEFFLSTLFNCMKENRGKRPRLFDAAFLMTRYRTEYAMLEIPGFVRTVILPLMFVLGTLLRRYDKFKDAPKPLKG
jgi:quercetin dioxygenase-like cupin family protein